MHETIEEFENPQRVPLSIAYPVGQPSGRKLPEADAGRSAPGAKKYQIALENSVEGIQEGRVCFRRSRAAQSPWHFCRRMIRPEGVRASLSGGPLYRL
jgi:hypothetical protein